MRELKAWKIQVELQLGKKFKYLTTDNVLDICNESFNNYCMYYGITRHTTITYTLNKMTTWEDEQNPFGKGEVYVNKYKITWEILDKGFTYNISLYKKMSLYSAGL